MSNRARQKRRSLVGPGFFTAFRMTHEGHVGAECMNGGAPFSGNSARSAPLPRHSRIPACAIEGRRLHVPAGYAAKTSAMAWQRRSMFFSVIPATLIRPDPTM